MSFSKNIRHCRTCINIGTRQFQTDSSSGQITKMSARVLPSQWKFLIQFKEFLNKVATDKNVNLVLSKELAAVLQKIQPSVYGKTLIRNFESITSIPNNVETVNTPSENKSEKAVAEKKEETKALTKEQGYKLPNVLTGLALKITNKQPNENEKQKVETVPKWKTKQQAVFSHTSVNYRTRHVISSILMAENEQSRLNRIEELSQHLQQFPEARGCAVKDGAVRILLRMRESTDKSEISAAINEVFAILGYVDPPRGRGVRILSIDGGGTRGLLVVQMLKKLEELTGMKIHEMFDYVCGVSTGAILAAALAANKKTLDDLSNVYKEISTKIFTQSAWVGTSSLVWSHSYYDTELWEILLRGYLGETKLISTARDPKCPKFCTVSAIVNQSALSAFVFRNYSLPYRVQSQYPGGSDYAIWQAVRASAAAPTYFEEYKLGGLLHQDGGVMVNNPTAVAIHEAKQLWPNTPIQCVVSFGTGRTHPAPLESDTPITTANNSSWKTKFMRIVDSATDTEGVHTMLSDLLPHNVYFRFNPYLTEMLSFVEIRPEKIQQMEGDAIMYMRRNEDKFQEAAKAVQQSRTVKQKAGDWVDKKALILGLKGLF